MKVIPREVVKRKHAASWSKEIREMRHKLQLTSLQKSFLVGTILGDGCLTANVGKKNFRLQVEQSAKQKDYVWWKYQIFREWVLMEPKFQPKNRSWRFRTISHPDLNEFHQLFYQGKKKIVPKNIGEILTDPFSLAVWFMDDGALGPKRKGSTFNSQNFDFADNQKLRNCLKANFGLETSLHKDKTSWRIYVLPKSITLLRTLIMDIVLPEMRYKFPFY
ncbi:hypothetical protein COS21_03520 [bacterium (Candidatus Gribaldobacteria) CG02_land_8_20_14_3_00_41_15]|uniref:Homing endonuclease LAGLIDADG domain-containing protein n=1 Tax=bacterium (Candidatus Gribaldobacteria) CG02_land_8_20_14_3_00_41_15 TaxID=2014270 RepID=A0A2M7DD53_9BACT|nr:MAG: hypothetical protein COS21_03520 [bacterium (Candidatus Gribaldobacteria) CG02_land_8_20_14_3_00_41_15]